MEIHQGIILGIIQGLTEFLPVSSSGHLVLGQIFFGIKEPQLTFDISVHTGTLLAVLVVYWSDINAMIKSVFKFCLTVVSFKPFRQMAAEDRQLQMAGLIVLGSFPTAAVGLWLKQFEQVLFSSEILVGCMLVLTGVILWTSRQFYFSEGKASRLDTKKALFIGLIQGIAVIPGISRSGSTIATGMFMKIDRHTAAKFSFLLSVPAIFGAELLSIRDMIKGGFSMDQVTLYATIASFITGLIALKLLLGLVHSGKFHLFAPYCWVIGSLVLLSKLF